MMMVTTIMIKHDDEEESMAQKFLSESLSTLFHQQFTPQNSFILALFVDNIPPEKTKNVPVTMVQQSPIKHRPQGPAAIKNKPLNNTDHHPDYYLNEENCRSIDKTFDPNPATIKILSLDISLNISQQQQQPNRPNKLCHQQHRSPLKK